MKSKNLSFEDALKKLEAIAQRLESEDVTLDETLKLYEEGMKLSKFCSDKLNEAENRIKLLEKTENGIKVKDFNIRDSNNGNF